MTIIHMEVETVRSLANRMQLFAEALTQRHQSVNNFVRNIDWSGDARERFSADANSVINSLDKMADSILISSRHLSKEVEQWVSVDSTGSEKIQAINPPANSSFMNDMMNGIRAPLIFAAWISGKIDSWELNEVWWYLGKTSTGKDLERLARENNMCFILPNGERIGDPNAVIQVPVNFGKTESGGYFDPDTNSIIISDDRPLSDGVIGLSGTLAHEMQHAIDHASGEFLPIPPLEGQSEAQLEASLEKYWDAYIHSETRAYERSENVSEFTDYFDDGVLTGSERSWLLNYNNGSYKTDYENWTNGLFDGQYTTIISVDPATGELDVNLIPVGQPLSEFAYTA